MADAGGNRRRTDSRSVKGIDMNLKPCDSDERTYHRHETETISCAEKKVRKLNKNTLRCSLEDEESDMGQILDHKESDAAKLQQHSRRDVKTPRRSCRTEPRFSQKHRGSSPESCLKDKAPEPFTLRYLSTLPPDTLEEVILTCSEAQLAALPSSTIAEARRLREQSLRTDKAKEALRKHRQRKEAEEKVQEQRLKAKAVLDSRERERFEEIISELSDEIVEGFKRARMKNRSVNAQEKERRQEDIERKRREAEENAEVKDMLAKINKITRNSDM